MSSQASLLNIKNRGKIPAYPQIVRLPICSQSTRNSM